MLQASLYKDVQKLFSEKNSLVFLNRADEFFAITNGLTLDDHIEIQKELAKNFDLKLSMSIGFAETHFDVENLTSKRQNTSPFEISSMIFKLYSKMTEFFLKKNSLTFFMGGDNFMVVSDEFANKYAKEFIALAKKELEVTLNCGIGTGKTAREAVKLATKSLDTIRQIRDSGKEKPEIYELSCF